MAFSIIDNESMAGRVLSMANDLRNKGRISHADFMVIHDLLWHPNFPDFLKSCESAPKISRQAAPLSGDDGNHPTTIGVPFPDGSYGITGRL